MIELPRWHYAQGLPQCRAAIKQYPEDFRVTEQLGFDPDKQGQHLLLQISKRQCNTEWVARQIAKHAKVPVRHVGYAGLKDHHAVCSQWFSVDLAGRDEPEWQTLNSEHIEILQTQRHRRKLRRGSLSGNDFVLTLRQLQGDFGELEQRLHHIGEHGVPNYFGEQRFGRQAQNLEQALAMFRNPKPAPKRHLRGLYLSAARSFLFNQVLSQRVAQGNWNQIVIGEAVLLAGSNSYFVAIEDDMGLPERLAQWDIHPSGPLCGADPSPALNQAANIETQALEDYYEWQQGLASAGLTHQRRASRMRPQNLGWEFGDDCLTLHFSLASGCYATTVLRELCLYQE